MQSDRRASGGVMAAPEVQAEAVGNRPAAEIVRRDPSRTHAAVERFVEALVAALDDPVDDANARDARVHASLAAVLDVHGFLRLKIEPRRALWRGRIVSHATDADGRVFAYLADTGIEELIFKIGVELGELHVLLETLRRVDELPPDRRRARLWELDLRRTVVGMPETTAFAARVDARRTLEAFDYADVAETSEATFRAATAPMQAGRPAPPSSAGTPAALATTRIAPSPQLETDGAATVMPRGAGDEDHDGASAWQPQSDRHLDLLRHTSLPEDLCVLVRRLAALFEVPAPAEVRRAAGRGLAAFVDAAMAEGRWATLAHLAQELADSVALYPECEPVLRLVQRRVCGEQGVLALGAVLQKRGKDPKAATRLRLLLTSFGVDLVDSLLDYLDRFESMEARKRVCDVLAVVVSEDPGALARRAEGRPWFVVRNLAYVMGRIGDAKVVPYLKHWSYHEDERVRTEVARALGRVPGAASGALLCRMLADAEQRVRLTAMWSLAGLDEPTCLPRLKSHLEEDRTFRTRSESERDDLFRVFGRLANERAYRTLVHWIESRQWFVGWKRELRRGAAVALGEARNPEARQVLQRHLRVRDSRLRRACEEALRAIANRQEGVAAPEFPEVSWDSSFTATATARSEGAHV